MTQCGARMVAKMDNGGWKLEAAFARCPIHHPPSIVAAAGETLVRSKRRCTPARAYFPSWASHGTAQPKATRSTSTTVVTGRRSFGMATDGAMMITVIAMTITV